MKVETWKLKLLVMLFGFMAAALITSCYTVEETATDDGGSSGGEVCFRECPYTGWGAFLTPSCWETVPCGTSLASLYGVEDEASLTMDPVVLLLGEASSEGSVSLLLGGRAVYASGPDVEVVLTNLTTGVSWLAQVSQDSFSAGSLQWSSVVPLDSYSAIYGENRFLVELFDGRSSGSTETRVDVGW